MELLIECIRNGAVWKGTAVCSIVCRIVGYSELVVKSLFIEVHNRGKDSDETRQVRSWWVSGQLCSFAERTSLFEEISLKV